MPKSDEITPAPIRYKAGEGKSGYTGNEVVRVLVEKYGVSPEQAVAMAEDLKKSDPEGIQSEAVGNVANREVRRLQLMKRYTDIVRAQEAGEAVDEREQAWAAKVSAKAQQLRTQRIQQTASDSKAARETADFNKQFDEQARVSRKVQTMRNYRPGMIIGPDQQSLTIPVNPPPSKTVTAIMNNLGLDEGSASLLAAKLEGQ